MSFITYKQADSRWGKKNYNGSSSMATAGCGPTACAMIAYGINGKTTPLDTMKYMQSHGYAIRNNGTAWNGIPSCLKAFGLQNVQEVPNMTKCWELMKKGYVGVFLFRRGTRGGITWTTSGHYIAVTDYKIQNGRHYIYTRDSGGRNHTGWYCYETQMVGLIPKIWLGSMPKAQTVPTQTTSPTKGQIYTGTFPTKTIKKGNKGEQVKRWQNFLKWMGYNIKADGVFGKITYDITKAAQKKLGFTGKNIDGIVGPSTIKKAKTYQKQVSSNPTSTPISSGLPKKCIDVSYWQGKISKENWDKIKKSCGYAICRASYTSQSKFALSQDSTFATNFVNAKAAGLKVGAYHYSQAITVNEAKREAEYLCSILKNYTPTFYVVCDFEYGGRLNSKIGKKASDIANAFCDVVKAHGYNPCIYANTSTLNSNLTNPKYPVWVAQYASSCSYKGQKVMWQYTSSGRVNGISASNTNSGSANVDLSHVYIIPQEAEQTLTPTPTPTPTPAVPVRKAMSVIGHARSDVDGKAGDSTGTEVLKSSFVYSKSSTSPYDWTYVFRPKDVAKAEKAATMCEKAIANNNIGYNSHGETAYGADRAMTKLAKAVNYDLSKISVKCGLSCGDLICLCNHYAGLSTCYIGSGKPLAENYKKNTNFEVKSYTKGMQLYRGDVLITAHSNGKHNHVVMCL